MNQLREEFLEEINTSCYSVNSRDNEKIKEQEFLKQRFHPDNYQRQHEEIAREINNKLGIICTNSIFAAPIEDIAKLKRNSPKNSEAITPRMIPIMSTINVPETYCCCTCFDVSPKLRIIAI